MLSVLISNTHTRTQLRWRLSDDPVLPEDDDESKDPEYRKTVRAKIFLGYTSNLISSGLRESLRFLAEHKMVGLILTCAFVFLPRECRST